MSAQQKWRPRLENASGPAYLRIVQALADDIASGRLPEGTRLPPQRELCRALSLNLSTVTRALAEAQRRGLVSAVVGRGTFVSAPPDRAGAWGRSQGGASSEPGYCDLTFNVPPPPVGIDLGRRMAERLAEFGRSPERCLAFVPYHAPAGATDNREAAAGWLRARGVPANPALLLVCAGAQHALSVALAAVTSPGDVVLCEDLTYPGLLNLAGLLRLRVIGVPTDGAGLIPDAFAEAAARHRPRIAFCSPTIQNPTVSILGEERRRAIAALAERHQVLLLEDDVYGPLVEGAPPSLAALAPHRTLYVSGLSKTLAPGLRIGYLSVPDGATMDRCESVLQATMWMIPPLMAAIASEWLRDGTAEQAMLGIRQALERRNQIVREELEAVPHCSYPTSPHVWIPLGPEQNEGLLAAKARERGVGIVTSTAFRAPELAAEPGLRVCLGAAGSEPALRNAIGVLRALLQTGERTAMRLM